MLINNYSHESRSEMEFSFKVIITGGESAHCVAHSSI